MISRDPIKVVYILGAGHSGSTLVNLILNAHPDVIGLGEVDKVRSLFRSDAYLSESSPSYDFWRRVKREYESYSGAPFESLDLSNPWRFRRYLRLPRREREEIRRCNERFFKSVAVSSGKKIIVDSSKNRGRLFMLSRIRDIDLRVIHLVRDVRAVAHSWSRKYPGDLDRMESAIVRPFWGGVLMRSFVQRRAWIRIRYEDLCRRPDDVLKYVCQVVGVPYDPAIKHYGRGEQHTIAGNRMRNSPARPIRLNEAWREQMPVHAQVEILNRVGWVNRIYGYAE